MNESGAPPTSLAAGERWAIVQRFQEYDGELSANLLRVVGVLAFYGIELANYHGVSLGPLQLPKVAGVDQRFHFAITALAVAWVAVAAAVLLLLRNRFFPASLKFITTAADVLLLTAMLLIADGPKSTLTVGYFLVVTLSVLRFSRHLVSFATAASVVGYGLVVANAHVYRPALKMQAYQELMTTLGLVLVGVVLARATSQSQSAASHLAAFSPDRERE